MSELLFDLQAEPPRPHVLVVTEADDGGLAYEIECPGVTSRCRLWLDCPEGCDERASWDDEFRAALEAGQLQHGERHVENGDRGWAVPTSRCYLREFDDLAAVVEDLVEGDLRPDRYLVLVEFDDDRPVLELVGLEQLAEERSA